MYGSERAAIMRPISQVHKRFFGTAGRWAIAGSTGRSNNIRAMGRGTVSSLAGVVPSDIHLSQILAGMFMLVGNAPFHWQEFGQVNR